MSGRGGVRPQGGEGTPWPRALRVGARCFCSSEGITVPLIPLGLKETQELDWSAALKVSTAWAGPGVMEASWSSSGGADWETSSWVDTAELVLLPRAPAPPTPGGCALRPVPVVRTGWFLSCGGSGAGLSCPLATSRQALCEGASVPLWPAAPAPRGWYSNSSRSSAASGPMSVGRVARGEDLGGPSPGPGPPLSGFPPCGARRPGKASVPAPPGADLRALWRGRQHL